MSPSQELIDRLASAHRVAAFTGAGISAESGVATFRAQDGLWSKFKPEELASVDAFLANPQMVWEWYQARRAVILEAEPNAGHRALVELEELVPSVSVITQNIDGLHTAAGSREVIELHGNIRRNYCQQCRRRYDGEELLHLKAVQACECGGKIRPDVVWFGENLPAGAFERAEHRAEAADVFFSIGTSAVVYPAAGLPVLAAQSGAYLVEINPEATPLTRYANESIRSASGTALAGIVQLLRGHLAADGRAGN
ncbi:MAG TPA: NAD-dependent deacylase [Candidatus Kapabacteria bacterium]|nr:NAD-dependent deacylase [Candidatus Kapabacteria bacterium]